MDKGLQHWHHRSPLESLSFKSKGRHENQTSPSLAKLPCQTFVLLPLILTLILRTSPIHTHPLEWPLTSQYHQPLIFPPARHPLSNVEKKANHESAPIYPRKRGRNARQRHRRLDDVLRVPNAHSRANLVAENLHSDKVLISTTERSTIPACVYLATSGGVDPISIGII